MGKKPSSHGHHYQLVFFGWDSCPATQKDLDTVAGHSNVIVSMISLKEDGPSYHHSVNGKTKKSKKFDVYEKFHDQVEGYPTYAAHDQDTDVITPLWQGTLHSPEQLHEIVHFLESKQQFPKEHAQELLVLLKKECPFCINFVEQLKRLKLWDNVERYVVYVDGKEDDWKRKVLFPTFPFVGYWDPSSELVGKYLLPVQRENDGFLEEFLRSEKVSEDLKIPPSLSEFERMHFERVGFPEKDIPRILDSEFNNPQASQQILQNLSRLQESHLPGWRNVRIPPMVIPDHIEELPPVPNHLLGESHYKISSSSFPYYGTVGSPETIQYFAEVFPFSIPIFNRVVSKAREKQKGNHFPSGRQGDLSMHMMKPASLYLLPNGEPLQEPLYVDALEKGQYDDFSFVQPDQLPYPDLTLEDVKQTLRYQFKTNSSQIFGILFLPFSFATVTEEDIMNFRYNGVLGLLVHHMELTVHILVAEWLPQYDRLLPRGVEKTDKQFLENKSQMSFPFLRLNDDHLFIGPFDVYTALLFLIYSVQYESIFNLNFWTKKWTDSSSDSSSDSSYNFLSSSESEPESPESENSSLYSSSEQDFGDTSDGSSVSSSDGKETTTNTDGDSVSDSDSDSEDDSLFSGE